MAEIVYDAVLETFELLPKPRGAIQKRSRSGAARGPR